VQNHLNTNKNDATVAQNESSARSQFLLEGKNKREEAVDTSQNKTGTSPQNVQGGGPATTVSPIECIGTMHGVGPAATKQLAVEHEAMHVDLEREGNLLTRKSEVINSRKYKKKERKEGVSSENLGVKIGEKRSAVPILVDDGTNVLVKRGKVEESGFNPSEAELPRQLREDQ
jgi:hypothetical protein